MIRQRRASIPTPPSAPKSRSDLVAFLETSRIAARGGDVGASLSAILDCAIRLLDADEGSVMTHDAAGLKIVAARGIPEEIRRGTIVPVGQGIVGAVFKSGRPLLLASPLDVSRFEGYVPKQRPINSAMCVPLRAQDRIIGVLNLNLVRPGEQFDEEDLQIATLFAEHVAIAISTAELLGRTQRNSAELETLRTASGRLGRSLRLDTVADTALTEALAIAGSSIGMLVLGAPGRIELARYRGLALESAKALLRTPSFAQTLTRLESTTILNVRSDPVFASLASDLGNSALVVAPVPSAEGASGGILAVAIDAADPTSERMLTAYATEAGLAIANAALHEQVRSKEEELSTIVEAIANPIILVDQRGIFRAFNPAAAETFHLSADFEIGQPVKGRLGDLIEELMFTGGEGTREVVLPVGGDPHVWRATVTTTRSGPVVGGRLLVLEDVTLQRELEQRKADFLALIGHELRTPLTIIRGFATTLARTDVQLSPSVHEASVSSILEQSAKLGQMIEDLLYVSRIENNVPPLHFAWNDVVDCAKQVIEIFLQHNPGRVLSLRTNVSSVHMLFDQIKIEQVLRHLIDNAIKYSDPDAPVVVSIDEEADDVRISVIDKGIGIFSGDIPRLFRVFGQLDSSSTRRHGGTGIGLSVCKTLVETMGGRIWAQSMLGKGSEFSFTVPKTPPASERVI
ncbi:MAG: ATP-binding protein [Actinomycetota bacterium]